MNLSGASLEFTRSHSLSGPIKLEHATPCKFRRRRAPVWVPERPRKISTVLGASSWELEKRKAWSGRGCRKADRHLLLRHLCRERIDSAAMELYAMGASDHTSSTQSSKRSMSARVWVAIRLILSRC